MDAEAVIVVAPSVGTEVDRDGVGQTGDEPVLRPGAGTTWNKDQIGQESQSKTS